MAASVISEGLSAHATLTEPVNILLVDDQPSRLLTYRTILGDLNENLIDASSGTEALKLLMVHDFALILLDVNMPGLDGFETANLIHQHPRFEKTPIIFITAINLSDLDRMPAGAMSSESCAYSGIRNVNRNATGVSGEIVKSNLSENGKSVSSTT